MSLGDKIRELLARRGWSASRLAGKVKVSPAAISRIIAGGDTSTSIGFRLSRELDVPPAWLFDDSVGMESLSEYEQTLDLAGVPDLDLVRILEARVKRSEAAYAKALKTLKAMPTSKEGSRSPDQEQALRDALARSGYDGRIYLGLLHGLLKLQECLAQTGKERLRFFHVDLINPEFRDVLDKIAHPSEELVELLSPFKKLAELLSPLKELVELPPLLSSLKPKKSKRKPRS